MCSMALHELFFFKLDNKYFVKSGHHSEDWQDVAPILMNGKILVQPKNRHPPICFLNGP